MKKLIFKRKFTLIEMMVVIAIIVILFALLMPAIYGIKERAKRTDCLSRVKDATALTLLATGMRDGRLFFSGSFYNPSTQDQENAMFQLPVVTYVRPDVAKRADATWRTFICTNVLPLWNAGSSTNAGGYTPGQPLNYIQQEGWETVDPSGPKLEEPWYLKGNEKQGPVYMLGNFNTNMNGFVYEMFTGTGQASVTEKSIHLSQVKSPGKRAYIIEEGEQSNNELPNIAHVKYTTQISRGVGNSTASGYIPGLGGGGIGQEKIEKIGYDSTITSELDEERYELVTKDVEEGRHYGATIHAFFDGHVEVLSAADVGAMSLGPGETAKNDLKGPYGYFTRPYDED